MALTSRDETDLLLPLFGGHDSRAPFQPFLERLLRRTGAAYSGLLIQAQIFADDVDLFVGPDLRGLAQEQRLGGLHLTDRHQQGRMRLGRVYGGEEFAAHDPALKAARARAMRQLGLADDRVVRIMDEEFASAWLLIASEVPCSAADSALLSSLVPYVGAAVRSFVLEEQRKLDAALDRVGLDCTGSGWIAFDRTGRVLSVATSTAQALGAAGMVLRAGQRPRALGPDVEREIIERAACFAGQPSAPDHSLVLMETPRIEAVLSGLSPLHCTGAVMVARCRHPRTRSAARAEHFARLHALPRREAELAILLADGHSLAEAGQALGLTIETTRNYSKRLFAKVGVRGQAELVRAVYESCAILA